MNFIWPLCPRISKKCCFFHLTRYSHYSFLLHFSLPSIDRCYKWTRTHWKRVHRKVGCWLAWQWLLSERERQREREKEKLSTYKLITWLIRLGLLFDLLTSNSLSLLPVIAFTCQRWSQTPHHTSIQHVRFNGAWATVKATAEWLIGKRKIFLSSCIWLHKSWPCT